MEQLQANGQARAQREPRLPPEPAPPPDRLQREPAQQLQRELLPNPKPTRVERDNTNTNDNDDNSMPGLLGQDSYDNDAESDDDKEEREFYRQRSGREVEIGEHDGFRRTRRKRRVIPPDKLGANPAHRDIGFPGENMGAYQCGRKPAQKI
jgi:hypothetical protein